MSRPHIVVLGGGFAGINAVKRLAREEVRITLIDRENHHLFQPLLYQVASAVLNPADIAYPLRRIFENHRNVRVLLAEAQSIDLENRRVRLENGGVQYDYLLIATGSSHTYFGNDSWEEHAPGLKTVEDALEIRRRVLLAYEGAERESDPERRRAWLRFVVIGAGPTGVELAGAMAEIGKQSASGFQNVSPGDVEVLLVEGLDRVLPAYEESLSHKAEEQLEGLGVQVWLGARVTDLDGDGLSLEDGTRVDARTVVWAAGVKASPLVADLGVDLDKAGRVKVCPDLSVPGRPEVFVAGDLAAMEGVPGLAPAAIQQGKFVAKAILARIANRDTERFEYRDRGMMATIGRAAAVADFGWTRISGVTAWLAWLFVHILFLIGFRNRVWVLLGWAWSYLSFQRGARLITGRKRHRPLPPVD